MTYNDLRSRLLLLGFEQDTPFRCVLPYEHTRITRLVVQFEPHTRMFTVTWWSGRSAATTSYGKPIFRNEIKDASNPSVAFHWAVRLLEKYPEK